MGATQARGLWMTRQLLTHGMGLVFHGDVKWIWRWASLGVATYLLLH